MTNVEKRAWTSFVDVCKKFLGNNRSEYYIDIINELMSAYQELGCNMSLKLHYLHSHLDFFPENLGQFSDEHGERFHQEMLQMEIRYEGKSRIQMLTNYCWSLKRETSDEIYKKRRTSKHF